MGKEVIVLVSSALLRGLRICAGVGILALGPTSAVFAQSAPAGPAPVAQDPGQQPGAQQIREELDRLRREFEAIRDSYGARLAALEAKLGTGETPPPAAATPPAAQPVAPPAAVAVPAEVSVPAGAAGAGGPQGSLPVYGGTSALSKIFNPDIAVIGNFLGAAGENDIDPAPALAMDEAEASFQAVVDPYARADFFFAFSPEGVEIEEGFITFTSLPGGLLAKVGKVKQQVGKVNTLHAHLLPWIDRPLAAQNLLGGEEGLADAGISVSKLIINPVLFLEATGEVYQGDSGVFASHKRSDVSWVGRLRGYRDMTESSNLDIGASIAGGHNDVGPDFSTRIFAVDATFRYRPLRRAIYRRFLGRTELFWSKREQEAGPPRRRDREDVSAFGMYASADYQFARRWFAGARYDWSERADDSSLVDKGGSFLVTFWPSEFSQLRGQYRRLRYAEGSTANEFLFQFLFSIGAHGAHVF
jgi:hypothetical protein